jgi:hypothetical protein
MRALFLGKPLHWLILVVLAGAFWYAGSLRVHIVHFDAFVVALLVVSTACVLIVLYGPGRGTRLTRDEIVPDETELRLDDSRTD